MNLVDMSLILLILMFSYGKWMEIVDELFMGRILILEISIIIKICY